MVIVLWSLWVGAAFPALGWYPEWHGCAPEHQTDAGCHGAQDDDADEGGLHQCGFTALAQAFLGAAAEPLVEVRPLLRVAITRPADFLWVRVLDEGGWPMTQGPPTI